MSRRVFQCIAAVAMAALVLCFALVASQMNQRASALRMADCRGLAAVTAALAEQGGAESLEALGDQLESRVVWLSDEGVLRFDSDPQGESAQQLSQAEDVLQARQEGSGESRGGTVAVHTDSYSLCLADGSVLRVSSGWDTLATVTGAMLLKLLLLAGILLLAAAWLAWRTSKRILAPLTGSDLYHLDDGTVCEELRPFIRQVSIQSRQSQRQIQRQMNDLRREYEKQDRMRRDFTANVSHELKTPLTSISGYAEIIREGMVKVEDISRFAGKIYEETQRLIALVGDILNLSQLDDGYQLRARRSRVDLYSACEKTIASLHEAAERRGITFTLSGEHGTVEGVEKILEEISYNLCDNAIKYNKENGQVEVSVTREGDRIVLAVKDTGIGIPEGETERVFERFYRVDKSHSKEIGGTGLGLSIVKHAAAYHDAKLEVNSELGRGTVVRVLFHTIGEEENDG